eukprot:scaffold98836_cov42-Phaeocystis_antarctica.AAC.2
MRTRATRSTSRTPNVAAPRHNPRGARRIPARNPSPSPCAYPAALAPTPDPAHASPALRQVFTNAPCVARAAAPTVVVPRQPGRRRDGKVRPTRTANPRPLDPTPNPHPNRSPTPP